MLAEAFDRPEPALDPDPAALTRRGAVAGAAVPAGASARQRQAALHSPLRQRRSTRRHAQCGLLLDEWTEVIPGTTQGHRHRIQLRPARQRAAAVDPARHARDRERHLAVGGPRRRAERDARPGEEPRGRAGAGRQLAYYAFPAGDDHGRDALRHLDRDCPRRCERRPLARRGTPMPSSIPGRRHARGARRAHCSPRSRSGTGSRAGREPATSSGRCRPRCATRYGCSRSSGRWASSAAATPARRSSAKLQLETTRLTKYRPDDDETQPFEDDVPLEAKVERGRAAGRRAVARWTSAC